MGVRHTPPVIDRGLNTTAHTSTLIVSDPLCGSSVTSLICPIWAAFCFSASAVTRFTAPFNSFCKSARWPSSRFVASDWSLSCSSLGLLGQVVLQLLGHHLPDALLARAEVVVADPFAAGLSIRLHGRFDRP